MNNGWRGRSKPLPYRVHPFFRRIPYVFAVLFEAAKAKSAVCNNRACLAKNAIAFFACNARPQGGHGGSPPCAFSLGCGAAETAFHLTRVKEMNNKPSIVRKLCSHIFSFFKVRLLIRLAFARHLLPQEKA